MNALPLLMLVSGLLLVKNFHTTEPRSLAILDEKSKTEELIIAPNPNSGYFIVTLPNSMQKQKGQVEISSLEGKKILTSALSEDHDRKMLIDITGSPKGIYFITVSTANDRITDRFVIQ